MERDYGREIDVLRSELTRLNAMLSAVVGDRGAASEATPGERPGQKIETMRNMHPDARLSALMEALCAKASEDGDTGAITYLGVYASGGRQSNWIRNEVRADDLLRLIENNGAQLCLACIGNNDRLRMLLSLLRAPRTVAQLVDQCGYSSTGQVYHHLKPLLALGVVGEDDGGRGTYAVKPQRVQGIIMLLAGISDMLDPNYTMNGWTVAE